MMDVTSNRAELSDYERAFIADMLSDAFVPYSREFSADEGARIIEGRIATMLAARGERGYREGWAARAGVCNAPDCARAAGHMGPHRAE